MRMNDGYTLVELLACLSIVAILAAITCPTFGGIIGQARGKAYLAEARLACDAVRYYITEQYAAGTLDEMKASMDLTMSELGSKSNALTELLEGSYTKGAKISGFGIELATGKLDSVRYKVDNYEIEFIFYDNGESTVTIEKLR